MIMTENGDAEKAANLRCLVVATHYCPLIGGAQTVYDALARCAPDQFHILTSKRDYINGDIVEDYDAFDKAAPYKITRLERVRPDFDAGKSSLPAKILATVQGWLLNRRLVKQIQFICQNEDIDSIWVGAGEAVMWLPPLLKRRMKKKIIVFAHGEEFSQTAHSKAAEKNRRQALQAADGVIGVSHYTTDLLVQKYGVDKSKVFLSTNGVDLDKFSGVVSENAREKLNIPAGPVVFSCGRLVARKGFDKLIAAWPGVLKALPDATLLIGGNGPLEAELKQQVFELGIGASAQFLGHIKPDDMSDYYGIASVFAMPNRTMPNGDTEGFGLVFLEASAMGTVSVAGRAGGTSDAVQDGKTGFLVDGTNQLELEAAIIKLLNNSDMRNQMSDAAQAFARTQGWHKKLSGIMAFMSISNAD